MELVFIRHGEGEHTLNFPDSLHMSDPYLTEKGKSQAKSLTKDFLLSTEDVVIVSPIRRTLQTAQLWVDQVNCKRIVHPLVSPRLFPLRIEAKTLPCDSLLPVEIIKKEFPEFEIENNIKGVVWTEGVNTKSELEFNRLANQFINWCRTLNRERVYIVSHDGTITSYRQVISGEKLTREDFPKEIGSIHLKV